MSKNTIQTNLLGRVVIPRKGLEHAWPFSKSGIYFTEIAGGLWVNRLGQDGEEAGFVKIADGLWAKDTSAEVVAVYLSDGSVMLSVRGTTTGECASAWFTHCNIVEKGE